MSPVTQTSAPLAVFCSPARSQAVPLAIGNWEPVTLLAEGTTSLVYRARPAGNKQPDSASYALKLLRPEWHENQHAVEAVHREALVAQSVQHRHVIPILDWHVAQPPYFVVMPLLDGWTLAHQLKTKPPLHVAVAVWIARQIAQGLEAIHAAGWLHGDIKPANTFVAPDGHVTLLDLGFAQPFGQPGGLSERAVVGTLHYMAPEVFTSALAADVRSDLYSLGIILYEMLTGAVPFEGCNPAEIAALQRGGIPDRLRCLNPLVPINVVQLVRQLIANDPARRPQSATELVRRLVAIELELLGQQIPG